MRYAKTSSTSSSAEPGHMNMCSELTSVTIRTRLGSEANGLFCQRCAGAQLSTVSPTALDLAENNDQLFRCNHANIFIFIYAQYMYIKPRINTYDHIITVSNMTETHGPKPLFPYVFYHLGKSTTQSSVVPQQSDSSPPPAQWDKPRPRKAAADPGNVE